MLSRDLLVDLKPDLIETNTLNPDYYAQYDVKRGLRNADGSKIIAGLTAISSITGVEIRDNQTVPVEGRLLYRGINIFDIVRQMPIYTRYKFERVMFLLFLGRWPNEEELNRWLGYFEKNRIVNQTFINMVKILKSKNVMNRLQTAVSALYGEDDDPDNNDPLENLYKSVALISKLPQIVAYSYLGAYSDNPNYLAPRADLSCAENFLYMLWEGRVPSPIEAHLLDMCLVLHAEHGGGNNSSFTTHVVTSSGSDIYSTIAAAIASLKGPLHGIANQKVMDMIEDIKTHVSDWRDESCIKAYLNEILTGKAFDHSGKIYGLGHAVYTLSDPRGLILKEEARVLAKEKNRLEELTLYFNIERLAPSVFDEIKPGEKYLAPNVDFYSGLVYDCLGLPKEVYTAVFALARSAGWCAHRIEEILSGKRIIRPSYKYVPNGNQAGS